MSDYFDFRYKFPLADLPTALQVLGALRAVGVLGARAVPENMLGDPRDDTGIVSATPTWVGRPGIAALSYTDPDTGQVITSPARGDPAFFYIHVRSIVDPATLPVSLADFGLIPTDPDESAAVLGVWA